MNAPGNVPHQSPDPADRPIGDPFAAPGLSTGHGAPPYPGYPGAYPGNPGASAASPGYPAPGHPPNVHPPTGSFYSPPPLPYGQVPYGYALVPTTPPPPPVRPTTVKLAVLAFVAISVLGVVSAAVLLTSSWWDQVLDQEAAIVQSAGGDPTFRSFVSFIRAFVIGISVVTLGLYALFAWKMWIGRNWARVTITVLAAVATLSGVNAGSTYATMARSYRTSGSGTTTIMQFSAPPLVQTIAWLDTALAVAAIVLMYLRASNQYFAESKLVRQFSRR